jgi:arabinogalactan endo-1,4-beta-galactosidase
MLRTKHLGFSSIALFLSTWASGAAAATPVPLANASFEQDGTGVASPVGWTSTGSIDADFTEGGGNTGWFRLSHWSANAYSVDTKQTVTGLRDGWYTVRARVRRSTGANNAYVELRCDNKAERVYVPVAWPSQWLQVVVSAPVRRGSCTIALHTDGPGGEWTNFDDIELVPGNPQLAILGADVSSLLKSEDLGGEYFDDETSCRRHRNRSALEILEDHGMNAIRTRVWVNPADGYHDRADVAEMAHRCDARGLDMLLDLHYSDTWADPGHQSKPAAWAGFTPAQLTSAIYDHTFAVCNAAKVHGRGPAMIQLGNELNSGMLWPDGHTWDPPNWDKFYGFLKAG